MRLLSAAWGKTTRRSELPVAGGTCVTSRAGLSSAFFFFFFTSGRSWLPAPLVRFRSLSCLRVDIIHGFSTQQKKTQVCLVTPFLGHAPWQPFSRVMYNRGVSCHQWVEKYIEVCYSRHGCFSLCVMLPKRFAYLKPNQDTVCIPLHSLSASDTDWTKRVQVPVAGTTAVFPRVKASSLMQCKH